MKAVAMCCGILFLLSLLFSVSVFIASPCVRFLFSVFLFVSFFFLQTYWQTWFVFVRDVVYVSVNVRVSASVSGVCLCVCVWRDCGCCLWCDAVCCCLYWDKCELFSFLLLLLLLLLLLMFLLLLWVLLVRGEKQQKLNVWLLLPWFFDSFCEGCLCVNVCKWGKFSHFHSLVRVLLA